MNINVYINTKKMNDLLRSNLLLLSLFLLLLCASWTNAELQCSITGEEQDPFLTEMTYDIGYGEQKTMVYVDPDVKTMYNGNPPASTKVVPKFNSFSVKFINMSNKSVKFYW